METTASNKYNVGGVALDRPFKIRRLGHFGFNAADLEASRHFYFDLLGFLLLSRLAPVSSAGTLAITIPLRCSIKRNSTNGNTPATMRNIFGRKTTSIRSPGKFRASPRWHRRADIFAT
jgi:hypothetical protein